MWKEIIKHVCTIIGIIVFFFIIGTAFNNITNQECISLCIYASYDEREDVKNLCIAENKTIDIIFKCKTIAYEKAKEYCIIKCE